MLESTLTSISGLNTGRALVIIISFLLAAIGTYVVYQLYFSPLRIYPGPLLAVATPIPFLWYLMTGRQCEFHLKLHEKYGDIVRVSPNQLSYSSAESWKDIYERRPGHAFLEKEPNFYIHPLNGTPSIVTAPNKMHSRLRRLYSHAFSEKALRDQEPLIDVYIGLLMQRLKVHAENNTALDIVKYYNWTTFDIIGDLALGEPFGCLKEGSYHPWIETTFASIKVAPIASIGAVLPGLIAIIQSLIPKTVMEQLRANLEFTTKKVRSRLGRTTDRADFMTRIMEHNDKHGMTMPEIESTSNHVIIGGGETTATALSGITYHLLKNESAMQKLKDEIRQNFDKESDITLARIADLPYMSAVINESLRLYPPFAGGFPRIVPPEGEHLLGKLVPGGTVVSINHWATYHLDRNFHQASSFVPERFLGDSRFGSDQFKALQPFSVGPRNCIGKNLAYFEMRIILARLLYNFDLILMEESKDWKKGQKHYLAFEKPPLYIKLVSYSKG